MTDVAIDASRHEFGNSVSMGLLIPYILKKSGNFNVTVYSKIDFDEEIRNTICHKFIFSPENKRTEFAIEPKRDIEAYFFPLLKNGTIKIKDIESIPYKGKNNPYNKPYVVFICPIYGYLDQTVHWRSTHSFELDICKQLKKYVNGKGYDVVSFGCSHSCSREHLEQISDKCFWYDMMGKDIKDEYNVRHINKMMPTQLEWMYFAKTSISLGGAFHVPMCFTVPGIGWDGQVASNYRCFSQMLSFKRNDLHYLPSLEFFPSSYSLFNGIDKNHFEIQDTIRDLFINKLEVIL